MLSLSSSFLPHCSFSSGACGLFLYADVKVGRLGGVCDGVEGGPVALHPVASFP